LLTAVEMHKLARLLKDPKTNNLFQNPMVLRAHFIRDTLKEPPDLSPQEGHSQIYHAIRKGDTKEIQKGMDSEEETTPHL